MFSASQAVSASHSRRTTAVAPSLAPSRGQWLRVEQAIMGTAIAVELWCEERAAGEAAFAAVIDEMHRIDRCMSPFKADSELSRINRDAARQAVPLSDEMYALLSRALEFSRASDGAFDVTFAAAGDLYDYRRGVEPDAAALAKACEAIGFRQLALDARTRSLRFGRAGMRIDLGGFAKGHAVDNAAAILARRGIAHAYISAGGDSRVIGDRRGRPWSIGVRDPRQAGAVVAVLPLVDAAVSTSGDYERFFERDGVRRHHIIDPKSGRSPTGLRSVTVIADDGLSAEAASKTVFVLGLERGLRHIESRPGLDAVIVDGEGRVHASSGLLRPAQAA